VLPAYLRRSIRTGGIAVASVGDVERLGSRSLGVIGSVDRGQQVECRPAILALFFVTVEETDGMIEEHPRLVAKREIDEGHGQDQFGDDGAPVVLPESASTCLAELSVERKSLCGPSRLPEPVRQVVRGDQRLPTPRSVPLLVAGQRFTSGGKDVVGRGVMLSPIP